MKFKVLITAIAISLALMLPVNGQVTISDISETFRIFEDARSLSAGADLTSPDYLPGLPEDYLLGPGDYIIVMAGSIVMDYIPLTISTHGEVLVPPVGNIRIEGFTVREAEDQIRDELSLYLKSPTVEIQLAKPRKIKVYLFGQVMLPGVYLTFPGATPMEFLQLASGLVDPPTPGSVVDETQFLSPYFRILNSSASRRVRVLRDGKEIADVDISTERQKKDMSDSVILQDGDVVYAPEIERPVIVRGGVVAPGKYEFGRDEGLKDVLLAAGGSTSDQFLSEVTVERDTDFGPQKIQVTVTRDYSPLDRSFELRPGDIVRVPETALYVYIMGGVISPGAYDYKESWTALDYLGNAGGIVMTVDYSSTVIVRHAGTPEAEVINLDFKNVMKGLEAFNPKIEPGDIIIVPYQNKPWPGPTITGTLLQIATFARFLWD